jgi:hypothetical protein
VEGFLAAIPDALRQADCRAVARLMEEAVGEPPVMRGSSTVGFGGYHDRYESGREGEWFLTGFSPRKNDLTLYITAGFDRHPEIMDRLGEHRTAKSCLYVKRIDDVDLEALTELIRESVAYMRKRHR